MTELNNKSLDYIKGLRRYHTEQFEEIAESTYDAYTLNRGNQIIPHGRGEAIHALGEKIAQLDEFIIKRSRYKHTN